jgi:peptidyl-prolyl cis-trans isomerase D
VFVFWGINWTLSAPNYAAKVNGSEVSANEVRQSYQQQLAQVERQSNGSVSDAQRNEIRRRVLDQYVNTEALVTRADALGYRVGDQELLDAMSQVPIFQVDGKFDKAHAVAVLRAQGRSIPEIEALFRRDAKLRQLDSALSLSSFATATEIKQYRALTRQQRELAWVAFSADKYASQATPDDAALKTYYDAHKSAYMTPETVDLRYLEISLSQLASKVTVDDAQLKTYYDEQKVKTPERFTAAEQRRVSHILLPVASPKDDAAVKAKAEGILKRAQAGEDFAALAKQFSQDPGSAQQGGDLGWSERKVWVAPFADAAFSMKVDEIRGPVKTQFGYHILKLAGIRPATVKTFEESKADLETEYRRNEAEKLFNNAQDQLADAALQNTTDIDVVARKAGLTVLEVPAFSRTDGGGALGKVPAVIEAARGGTRRRSGRGRGEASDRRRVLGCRRENCRRERAAGEIRHAIRPRRAVGDPHRGVRASQARGQADLFRRASRERRRRGDRAQRRARGAERSKSRGPGVAPAVCRSNRLDRGSGLRRCCARRRQGDPESTGNRVVD